MKAERLAVFTVVFWFCLRWLSQMYAGRVIVCFSVGENLEFDTSAASLMNDDGMGFIFLVYSFTRVMMAGDSRNISWGHARN